MSSTVTITPTSTDEIPRARISSRASGEIDQVYGRPTEVVIFDGCPTGLGIKIIGGAGEEGERDFGVFIKRIFIGGLVSNDGRLQEGDQLLEVNGDSVSGVTNKEAVQLLRQAAASDYIKLIVTRDEKASLEFGDCLDDQSESCGTSSVADQVSVCSHTSSRSPQGDNTAWSPQEAVSPEPTQSSPLQAQTGGSGSQASSPINAHQHTSPPMFSAQTHQLTEARYKTPGELPTSEDSDTGPAQEEEEEGYNSACSTPTLIIPGPTQLPAYGDPQPKVSNTTVAALGLARGPLLPSAASADGAIQFPSVGLLATSKTSTPHTGNAPLLSYSGKSSSVFEPSPVAAASVSGIDVFGSSCPVTPVVSFGDDVEAPDSADMSGTVSLDPRTKIRVEKLEVALRYLGIDPTPKEQQDLRNMVRVDGAGYVTYGDFVQAARQMFRQQLEGRSFGAFKPSRLQFSQSSVNTSQHSDLAVLLDEREHLKRDLERCQIALREKDKACSMAEEELLRVRKEAQGALQEARALRSKVHLAEQAQKAAQSMEHDYEEVVRLLEAENLELKARDSKVMDHPAVQKRLAVLNCQLRKADLSKKTYEVATEKLLQFVEAVHDVLTGQGEGIGLRPDAGRGEPPRDGRPPHYLGKHKRHTTVSIAGEARDVVKTVKSLIEVEPLPFGWEEAYTEDGVRYYINHVTQVTSWNHPLSNVEHSSSRPGSSQGRPLPPMPAFHDMDIPESRA